LKAVIIAHRMISAATYSS